MTTPARVVEPWDTRPYQRFATVRYGEGQLEACFEDGACVRVAAFELLRPGETTPDWERLTFNPHEIIVPTEADPIEISWLSIRLMTDPVFEAHWRAMAARHDQLIGERIARLRTERGVSQDELAARAGLPAGSLCRIELGHEHADFDTLEQILSPLGCSFDEFLDDAVDAEGGAVPASSATTPT